MPKIIVEDFGGKRSDAGMLGSGIYFASSARLECSLEEIKSYWLDKNKYHEVKLLIVP